MTAPSKTKTWTTNEVLTSSNLNTQFDDWVSYVGDRNDKTESWDFVMADAGTVAAPTFTFLSDTDTGMLRSAANELSLVINGATGIVLATTGVNLNIAGTLEWQVDSTQLQSANSGVFRSGNGTVSLPGISFTDDTDLGVFRVGANILGIATAATETIRFDASQNVHIQVSGAADVELEVSNGSSTGGGAIHRASSGTHSRGALKNITKRYNVADEKKAYDDIKTYSHVRFRYKRNMPDGTLQDDPTLPLHNGLVYEEVPDFIKDGKGAITIDDRIAYLELAMKELMRTVEAL